MSKYREIERKFIYKQNLSKATELLREFFSFCDDMEVIRDCRTTDFYWQASDKSTTLRLRDSQGEGSDGWFRSLKELTAKKQDKHSTLDRKEVNLSHSSSADAHELATMLLGKPIGYVRKVESIFKLPNRSIVISIARVNGDDNFVYVEVEGPSVDVVDFYVASMLQVFDMQEEKRSLYQIHVEQM